MSGDPCICGDTKTWHQECYRQAIADQAPAAQPLTWQSMETMPKDNRRAIFWVVPKTAEEAWLNTSGGPVLATGDCHMHVGTYQSWGSLYKATHWMPLPIAPSAQGETP